jgi:hypothetical protein
VLETLLFFMKGLPQLAITLRVDKSSCPLGLLSSLTMYKGLFMFVCKYYHNVIKFEQTVNVCTVNIGTAIVTAPVSGFPLYIRKFLLETADPCIYAKILHPLKKGL